MRKLFIFILISFNGLAQLTETASTNLFLNEDFYEEFEIIVDNDNFLLINIQENHFKRREKNLNLIYYAPDLTVIKNLTIPLKSYKTEVDRKFKNGYLYYLLGEQNSKKLELIIYDVEKNQWSTHEFEMLTDLSKLKFDIFSGMLLLYGEYNFKPVIEMHNLVSSTVTVLPEIHNRNKIIYDLKVNPYRNELYVILSDQNKCTKNLLTFDEEGKFVSKVQLGDKKHVLNKIEMRFNFNGEPIIMGTYNNFCNALAIGFYSGKVEKPGQLVYTEISGLPAYYNSLSSSRKRRWSLRKEKGKKNTVRQRVIYSTPFYTERGYQAIAEFYNQQSATGNPTGIYQSSRRAVDIYPYGYKISSLLTVGLGFDGEVLHDNLVKFEGNTFYELKPQTTYLVHQDSLYNLVPFKKNVVYFNMNSESPQAKIHYLFKDDNLRVNDFDFEVINYTPDSILAYGIADLQFTRNQQVFIRKNFIIKKLEIKLEKDEL